MLQGVATVRLSPGNLIERHLSAVLALKLDLIRLYGDGSVTTARSATAPHFFVRQPLSPFQAAIYIVPATYQPLAQLILQ